MPWWVWVLIAWFVVAIAAALFFGAMANTVKECEQAGRLPRDDGREGTFHDVA
ncbi:hypothetical protein [Geodermatophilus sp. URMC 64]